MFTIRNKYNSAVYRTILRVGLAFFIALYGYLLLGGSTTFLLAYLPLVASVLFVEQYYSSPATVLTNSFALLLLLLSEKALFDQKGYGEGYVLLFSLALGLLVLSFYLKVKAEEETDLLKYVRAFVGEVGSAKVLYGIIFIVFLSIEDVKGTALILSLGSVFFLSLFIRHIHKIADETANYLAGERADSKTVGRVISYQSPDMLTVELFRDDGSFHKERFHRLTGNHSEKNIYLKYIEDVITEGKRYLRFSAFGEKEKLNVAEDIFVHELSDDENERVSELFKSAIKSDASKAIGIVTDGSDIDVIHVKIIPDKDNKLKLEEGDLLSLQYRDQMVKYQIVGVKTHTEAIGNDSDSGYKIISAQQLGVWSEEDKKFANCSWVPDSNTLVFLQDRKDLVIQQNIDDAYIFGVVPSSNYPIYYNFKEGISHHTAVIGRTGSGKSQMTSRMINRLVQSGYKVVIFEIDQTHPQTLTQRIDATLREIVTVTWGYANNVITAEFTLNPALPVSVISWDNAEKTRKDGGPVSMAAYTAAVLQKILGLKHAGDTSKYCVVFEEAYDFIPESSFGSQNFGQPEVSRVSQLILKCRKHDVGALVITQRTALVTKTILYQCNTIIALQSFDETSKNFLGAYVNNRYLESMSILPRFTCMVVGKGSSCDKPVIVDFEEK